MNYLRYQKYKNSGNEWIGHLPEHWRLEKLKWCISKIETGNREPGGGNELTDGVFSIGGEHIEWKGNLAFSNPKYISESFYARMTTGKISNSDILLVKDGATIGKCAFVNDIPDKPFAINEHVFLIRSNSCNLPKFLYYFLVSNTGQFQIQLCIKGAAQGGLNSSFVNKMYVTLPTRQEQAQIVAYLDTKLTKIDNLISLLEGITNYLEEKRQAIVTQFITKGLNSNVQMKDSGVEWIGKIPDHWEIISAKRLFHERDERSITGNEELLTVSHLTGVTPRSEKNVNMFEAETTEGYKICYTGDLVINTMWAWMGAMGICKVKGIVSPSYNVYTPTSRLDQEFIDLLVRIPVFATEVVRFSKGIWSSRLRLYPGSFYEVKFPVPPMAEQHNIVVATRKEMDHINVLIENNLRAIEFLKERRSVLITAAVTGKIDVQTYFDNPKDL